MHMEGKHCKIAIVGAGSIGAEIALIDANREKAEAEILDIKHGASLGRPVNPGST
jgi:malate/lactate dehydrogenase